jgi:hypothetical protein
LHFLRFPTIILILIPHLIDLLTPHILVLLPSMSIPTFFVLYGQRPSLTNDMMISWGSLLAIRVAVFNGLGIIIWSSLHLADWLIVLLIVIRDIQTLKFGVFVLRLYPMLEVHWNHHLARDGSVLSRTEEGGI